jgi:HD-like signal output (HDOD) protein
MLAEPFQLIPTVPQPLWPLVQEKEVVAAVLANKMPMASCRQNYYAGLMLHNLSP